MSWMKRYYEMIVERMEKAFPELTYDDIAANMNLANNADEMLFQCMFDAEKKAEKKFKCVKLYKVLIKGYSLDSDIYTTKVFYSEQGMEQYVKDVLEYFDNRIDENNTVTIADIKEYIESTEVIAFKDYKFGWGDMCDMDANSIDEHTYEIVFDKPYIVTT